MVATTDQKARAFDLFTGVMELTRDGNRGIGDICGVLQTIKGHRDFMAVLRGTAEPNLRFDKRKDGWTLLDHAPRRLVSAAGLELVPFLRDGESSVRGYDLVGRARYELDADYGQEDAEFLLEHQDQIPVECRQYYFTRTVWRSTDGRLGVACLFWYGAQWGLRWSWLGDDFSSSARLLRPGK